MDGASGNEDSALRDRAKAILRASMHDLLSLGVAGHASEISSARVQESAGCYAQAWSASTLLEASLLIPDIPLPTGIRFLSLDGVR
jgi:glycogen debranching enzyme